MSNINSDPMNNEDGSGNKLPIGSGVSFPGGRVIKLQGVSWKIGAIG